MIWKLDLSSREIIIEEWISLEQK